VRNASAPQRDVFGTFEQFKTAHRQRIVLALKQRIAVLDTRMKVLLMEQMQGDLRDLSINPQEVFADVA
jgi:hypothetical protein